MKSFNIKSALLSQLSPDKGGEVIKSTEEMLWRLRSAALFIHEEEGGLEIFNTRSSDTNIQTVVRCSRNSAARMLKGSLM